MWEVRRQHNTPNPSCPQERIYLCQTMSGCQHKALHLLPHPWRTGLLAQVIYSKRRGGVSITQNTTLMPGSAFVRVMSFMCIFVRGLSSKPGSSDTVTDLLLREKSASDLDPQIVLNLYSCLNISQQIRNSSWLT